MSRQSVISQREWVDPFITFLAAACSPPGSPHAFYDEEKVPADADLAKGYGIVYTIDGGGYTGPPWWAPESTGVLVFQVTSTSTTKGGAQWLADRVRLSILSRADAGGFQVAFAPPVGWKITNREPDGPLPGVDIAGDSKNRVFSIPERYRFHVEPS